ncbi:MAG: leucyl/phenylalanyl-tRNA--protein transferase [Sphingomonadales bacterium]|jgi:leucyl/phenylalanyl-tRNA--protein transferase
MQQLTTDLLLRAYACGVFPMAESHDSEALYWLDPEERGVLPLNDFHIPRRLQRTVRQDIFEVRINTAFEQVMAACADIKGARRETWINDTIKSLYTRLYHMGHAHSVECWQGPKLVGGLYGVQLGAAFFGESMFHRITDASKVALVHLVARLKWGGFTLLDTQFVTDHLSQFGAREIPKNDYHTLLAEALKHPADFHKLPSPSSGSDVLQAITQTS